MNTDLLRDRLLTLRFELARRFGIAGLAAAVVSCVTVVTMNGALRVQADTLNLANEARPTAAAKKPPADAEAHSYADAALLASLPDLFPPFARSADDIAAILAHASENHLTVGSAEYLVVAESGGRYVRYQMLLPVKDQYGAIRRFLASVLNGLPNAALREIHVERPAVDGSVLDARVRFELVYGAARP
jgi:hypothetical protein